MERPKGFRGRHPHRQIVTRDSQHSDLRASSHLEEGLAASVDRAFHFRGDVTLARTDGSNIVGYLFNRGVNSQGCFVQLFETNSGKEISLKYSEIAGIDFTGRDTADGKHLEAFRLRHREIDQDN